MTAIRGPALIALIALVVLALAGLGAVTASAEAAADFYGVNGGRPLRNDKASRPAALERMRLLGLSYVRTDASWDHVERDAPVNGRHKYDWDEHDDLVGDLARYGLRWYPMVGYSTPWAASERRDPFSPPANDADFAAFAAALAARYGERGQFWADHPELPKRATRVYGIWNEPNNPDFWRGAQATPARYLRMYIAARKAIRAVDPGARVTTGGLLDSGALNAAAYLRAMIASNPYHGGIDAVDWHPYVGDEPAVIQSLTRARNTLTELGLRGVPIEISEVGWHASIFSPVTRGTALAMLAALLPTSGLGIERLMPYVWSGSKEWQLTDANGASGLSVNAYAAGIRAAYATGAVSAPPPVRKLSRCTSKSKRVTPAPAKTKVLGPRRGLSSCAVTVREPAKKVKRTTPIAKKSRTAARSTG